LVDGINSHLMGLDPERFGTKEGPTSSNCIEFCRYINPICSHSIRFTPFLAGVQDFIIMTVTECFQKFMLSSISTVKDSSTKSNT